METETKSRRLSEMLEGECGVVGRYLEYNDSALRLQELGVVEGSDLEVVRKSPMGGPLEIRVKGVCLSLRLKEAALIEVL